MRRNLLRKTEDKTPVLKDDNGSRKQGRGMLSLFMLTFLALFLNGNVCAETSPTPINSVQGLNSMTASGNYIVTADFDATGYNGSLENFTGTFNGDLHIISGLKKPLFQTITDGKVYNVILKNVNISREGDAGAIACNAKGYTRIYNCGILPTKADFTEAIHSSVVSTGNGSAGSIVGKLEDDSRVVNCYSYADVSSTGYTAGIVGNNTFSSTAKVTNGKYADLRTMVVNCMFYGDITGGIKVWPVYGGEKITNAGANGINNYNFYSDSCSFCIPLETSHNYNCSWPARYNYLTRYEFHRYLLNSNRELCGWWVGASSALSTMSTAEVQAVPKDASLMAKWVLDRNVAPFPILKPFGKYSSPINIDADASWRTTAANWEGKKLGTLKVTVKSGAQHNASDVDLDITITDMDTLHGDYCYAKVQLPYYNSVFGNPNGADWATKYAGNYTDYVVTGWDITSVTGGTTGTLVEDWQDGYNFADRDCTAKDAARVFAQGGYYYVPNNVTAITITAHWGKAVYLGNGGNYYDRVDFKHDNNKPGTVFAPAGTRGNTLANGQTIWTGKIADVALKLPTSGTVYDNALVLVGNHQYCTGKEDVNPTRSFTIMSPDFDFDDEPDYCLEWQLGIGTTRQIICPIRFDFLPVEEIGLCLKKDGSTHYYSLGCYRPFGHFEVTETALIRFGQFEFSNKNRTLEAPIIFNGGIYEQYVKSTSGNAYATAEDPINYIILGGNVYMPSFTPGAHVNPNASFPTRHCAVNVIGGKIDRLYLTGNYNDGVTPNQDNPHCYIDGGWFNHVASAGKEGINGDVIFKINHANIHEFYGGGVMSDKPVTGTIDVTINNSIVNKYCGGPKFGDMGNGKTVTTRATGTTFGVYYGAGNGGTNYVQYEKTDGTYSNPNDFNWGVTGKLNSYTPGQYRNLATGYMANYDMEMINVSTGSLPGEAVIRTYFYAAQYAATNTGTVTNILTDCTVKNNFYGAGNLGGVKGDVTSTLTDTKVNGSAFGAGFSAKIPEVTIYEKNKIVPSIDLYTGYITPQSGGTSHTYTWIHDLPNGVSGVDTSHPTVTIGGKDYYYTEISLTNLGTVTGNASLTLKGNCTVGTMLENGQIKPDTGNVFGGGHESAVSGDTELRIEDFTRVFGNIYGGGNMGKVNGKTKVIVNGQRNN